MDSLEEEVKRLEHTLAQYPLHSVIFYGSSTVRLWTHLAQAFPKVHVLNAGFGGSTLAACGWYFERLIVPTQPRAIILYAGDNDLDNDRQPEEVYLFFCALIDKMQRHLPNVPLYYVSIKPSPIRWGNSTRIRATNAFIKDEISRLPNATFIDLADAMLTQDGQPRPDLFEADGLHLNATGYALWQMLLTEQCVALTGDRSLPALQYIP